MYLTAIGKPETPDTINEELKAAGGFVAGSGELIWGVFNSTYGVKESYISPRYTGPLTSFAYAKINELLDAKMPVLAEIDFNPSQQGEQMHFVEIIAYDENKNYYANDPWSGTQINMNVYGSMDLSVYQFRAYNIPVNTDPTPDYKYFAEAFFSLCDILHIPHNRDTAEREITKFVGYEDQLRKNEELLKQKDAQVTQVQTEAKQLREQLTTVQASNKELTDQATKLKDQLTEEQLTMQRMDARIAELEKIQPVQAYSGIQLVVMGIKKMFGFS
jgi:hypothetical protein